MTRSGTRNKRPAIDEERLRELALAYVGRFATTRARLARYLDRKLRERGWQGEGQPDIDSLVDRFAELGYVDDAAYARMKGAAMGRRGLGPMRIRATLAADGVDTTSRADAEEQALAGRWEAAEILARRKRTGPYGTGEMERSIREKAIAMFLRAGHDMATARAWVDAQPGEFPERSE
jgi:regulatory protein